MFSIVAPIVIALMRAVFGIVTTVAGAVTTFVGSVQFQHTDGNVRFRIAPGTPEFLLASNATVEWRSASLATRDVGLKELAPNVLGVYGAAGTSDPAWVQQSAGRSVGTAGATNITITPATTGCSATLIAGRKYKFQLTLWTTTTTAADGLRYDFDGGGATMTSFMQNGFVTDTAGVRSLPQTTAIATDVTDTTTTGAAMTVIHGYMVCNAAGTFIPRFAKEADAAGAAITLNNAVLLVEDMP